MLFVCFLWGEHFYWHNELFCVTFSQKISMTINSFISVVSFFSHWETIKCNLCQAYALYCCHITPTYKNSSLFNESMCSMIVDLFDWWLGKMCCLEAFAWYEKHLTDRTTYLHVAHNSEMLMMFLFIGRQHLHKGCSIEAYTMHTLLWHTII